MNDDFWKWSPEKEVQGERMMEILGLKDIPEVPTRFTGFNQLNVLARWHQDLRTMTWSKARTPFKPVRTAGARKRKQLRQRHRFLRITHRSLVQMINKGET